MRLIQVHKPFAAVLLLLSLIAVRRSSYSCALTTPFWYFASFASNCSRCICVFNSRGTWKIFWRVVIQIKPINVSKNLHQESGTAWMLWWWKPNARKWPRTPVGRQKHASRRATSRKARLSCKPCDNHGTDRHRGRSRFSVKNPIWSSEETITRPPYRSPFFFVVGRIEDWQAVVNVTPQIVRLRVNEFVHHSRNEVARVCYHKCLEMLT